jgi:hypothetical protein
MDASTFLKEGGGRRGVRTATAAVFHTSATLAPLWIMQRTTIKRLFIVGLLWTFCKTIY